MFVRSIASSDSRERVSQRPSRAAVFRAASFNIFTGSFRQSFSRCQRGPNNECQASEADAASVYGYTGTRLANSQAEREIGRHGGSCRSRELLPEGERAARL
jgi:hypothetical protein